jgi:ParB-like chromosome segregation protein Spo0J
MITFTQLTDITVTDRQRKKLNSVALGALKTSIKEFGLLHPLTVTGSELVAGGRRLRAIAELFDEGTAINFGGKAVPLGAVPTIDIADLSLLQRKELEYTENKAREPLSWQEEVEAIAGLNELRGGQKADLGLKQTFSETASELLGRLARGGEIQKVSNAVKIAQHLADPMVAKAKNMKEALKQIGAKARVEHAKTLATLGVHTITGTRIHGDAFIEMAKLPDGVFTCIVTDPPYGIGIGGTVNAHALEHKYDDTPEYAMKCYELLAQQGFRVCAAHAHLYAFCDIRNFPVVSIMFQIAGWKVWDRPIIWKKHSASLMDYERGPRHVYEAILFASKGDMKVLKVADDVIDVAADQEKLHAAQKPVDLYENLLSRSCLEGEAVLDPFAGSGTLLRASERLHLAATTIEISEDYYAIQPQR